MLPSYQVVVKKQLIKVDLQGNWDNKSDLAYLNDLAMAMRNMQAAPSGREHECSFFDRNVQSLNISILR